MKFILQCSICLQSLCNPMSLSCGHTFCSNCIHNTLEKQEQSACPLCRQPMLISQNKSDELLSIVQQIYEKDGTEGLLNEFPQLVICLCCGLTPINPVVLPCQHMFCQKCIQDSLQEELLCPVCFEFSFSLKLSINQKYKDLINWYLKQFQIEEVQQIDEIVESDIVNGLPIFNYDQTVIVHMETQFTFFEFRYQEMIRKVCSGSCNFIVSGDFINGDLVKIKNIKQINNGYQVFVEAIARVKIRSVYNYINGLKTLYQQFNTQSFWLCSFQYIKDQTIKENSIQQYNNIVLTLDGVYKNIQSDMHSIFERFMKKLHLLSSAESSLILIATLKNNTLTEYYDDNVEKRIQQIQNYLFTLEQSMKGKYVQQEQKQNAKYQQQSLEIINYPEYDLTTQYFLNLFNLNKVLCF